EGAGRYSPIGLWGTFQKLPPPRLIPPDCQLVSYAEQRDREPFRVPFEHGSNVGLGQGRGFVLDVEHRVPAVLLTEPAQLACRGRALVEVDGGHHYPPEWKSVVE